MSTTSNNTVRQRLLTTLSGKASTPPPFIDRLDLWHQAHLAAGTLPPEYEGLPLSGIHADLGIGEQLFAFPTSMRLRGVELKSTLEGETIWNETDPIINHFPDFYDQLPTDKPGIIETGFHTPVGTLHMRHQIPEADSSIAALDPPSLR